MTQEESELLGDPLDEVPEREADDDCNARKRTGPKGEKVFDGYCNATAGAGTDHKGEGRCTWHGGDTPTSDENPDVGNGDQEGNDNAVKHGAFREFFTDSLTDAETRMIQNAEKLLEDATDAQRVGRTAASLCLVQYDRTGDERFMRRFESICDTFEIAPEDVQKHEHEVDGEVSGTMNVNISHHRVTEDDVDE